jgi:hypothetical protein
MLPRLRRNRHLYNYSKIVWKGHDGQIQPARKLCGRGAAHGPRGEEHRPVLSLLGPADLAVFTMHHRLHTATLDHVHPVTLNPAIVFALATERGDDDPSSGMTAGRQGEGRIVLQELPWFTKRNALVDVHGPTRGAAARTTGVTSVTRV